jgi:3-methyl-2-oxobutanoate hydroxymethyltransferase
MSTLKKWTTRDLRNFKAQERGQVLKMLTCYDFAMASMLNQTNVDLLLVGDSVGNVVLGFETTLSVTVDMMALFGAAVRRGAPDKFIVMDMPFGSTSTLGQGLKNAEFLMRETQAQAIKLEGAHPSFLKLIDRLVAIGIPVMGHIGLIPQSVHQLGGFYTHGKNAESAQLLKEQALRLQEAGAFSIVLECVEPHLAQEITSVLTIPTIGIGSGTQTDGQVLVTHDLLKLNANRPPKFVTPVADMFTQHRLAVEGYLSELKHDIRS